MLPEPMCERRRFGEPSAFEAESTHPSADRSSFRVRFWRERGSAGAGVNVVVLTKWVPEPEGTPTLGEDGLLVREGADGALDPGDEYGLEAALQLVEAAGDGEITLVSMGPEVAQAALQRGLAMGAHKGVRITDDRLRGADAIVTAREVDRRLSA